MEFQCHNCNRKVNAPWNAEIMGATCSKCGGKLRKMKNTNKIRWVCEKCGASGISIPKQEKVQPQASVPQNQPTNNYPHIVGQPINQRPSIQGQPIGYRGIAENLQSGMQDLNQGIRNMPHVVIGKKDPNAPPSKPFFDDKTQKTIDKIRKWGLIGAIVLVIGYAVYRIIGVMFG